jgi:hypothetical protein
MALNYGAQVSNLRPGQNAQGEKRPPAQTWLNIGMTVPVEQEDGSVVDTFVTALGIPLDNVELPEMRGNSATYAQVVQAKRAMIRAIMDKLAGVEAGTETAMHGFEVQVRKVGEKAEPEVTDAGASILDLISKRLSGKAA